MVEGKGGRTSYLGDSFCARHGGFCMGLWSIEKKRSGFVGGNPGV